MSGGALDSSNLGFSSGFRSRSAFIGQRSGRSSEKSPHSPPPEKASNDKQEAQFAQPKPEALLFRKIGEDKGSLEGYWGGDGKNSSCGVQVPCVGGDMGSTSSKGPKKRSLARCTSPTPVQITTPSSQGQTKRPKLQCSVSSFELRPKTRSLTSSFGEMAAPRKGGCCLSCHRKETCFSTTTRGHKRESPDAPSIFIHGSIGPGSATFCSNGRCSGSRFDSSFSEIPLQDDGCGWWWR